MTAARPRRLDILILDFGSQYTQLIARRVRECGVYCEIHPFDLPAARLRELAPKAVILSGGPASLDSASAPLPDEQLYALQVPLLGICYGMQLLARHFGGQVQSDGSGEFGSASASLCGSSELLDGLAGEGGALDVWMSHGDRVSQLPEGFARIARSEAVEIAAFADPARRIYGLQFHPEVTHTESGADILRRFAIDIAGCSADWVMSGIVEEQTAALRERLGGERVALALSGGVDSAVTAALLRRAVGDQLRCVFVDSGLLRLDEGDQVMRVFREQMGLAVRRVDAAEEFFSALRGESDPERKRKIIGRTFIEIFERCAREMGDLRWLAQGTIYPDVIESAGSGKGADLIKSHHNVGGLPERMSLKLVEPLRMLFKDEVRALGRELGLPRELIARHPFPGPGLAVRIPGEVLPESAELLRRADAIFMGELRAAGLYERVAQAFAALLPTRAVGVAGDGRRYGRVVALRAVETEDFMTADWSRLPHEFLDRVARRLMNEIPEIARVVYDVSSKPPATVEWE